MGNIKDGDVVEFIAISWDEPQWDFDYPTVVIAPCIKYSSCGESCEGMIENMACDISCDIELKDEDTATEFAWRGWKIDRLKRVIRERFNGKDTWKTKVREVVKQKVQFYKGDEGYLEFRILETHRA